MRYLPVALALFFPRAVQRLLPAFGLLAVLACSHHHPVVEPTEPEVPELPCPVLPPRPPVQVGPLFVKDYPALWSVRSNPRDADEAAAVVEELVPPDNLPEINLYRLNLRTGQRTLLARNVGDQCDWGRNGWIVFPYRGGQLWKIKASGDSLTRLTATGDALCPVWSRDGSRIAYLRYPASYQQSGLYIVSGSGQPLQFVQDARIRPVTGGYAFSPDNHSLALLSGLNPAPNTSAFGVFDLTTLTFRPLDVVPITNPPAGVNWLNDGRTILWSDRSVKELDAVTGQTRLVRSACAPDGYGQVGRMHIYPSPTPDEQRLLMITYHYYVGPDGRTHAASRLQTTDRNGQHIRNVPFQ